MILGPVLESRVGIADPYELSLPPMERYLVQLRLRAAARFPKEPGGVVRGLLSRALRQHDLPRGLIPFASDAGRTRFEAGARYRLAVTLVGQDRALIEAILLGLVDVGDGPVSTPAPTLGGNFEVERVETLPPVDLEAEVAAVQDREVLEVVFRSPLCLHLPRAAGRAPSALFDRDCFPAQVFLDRVWRRLFFLEHGRYPIERERSWILAEGSEATVRCCDLQEVATPVRGTRTRKASYQVVGVRGRVELAGLTSAERRRLLAGMFLHVGKSVAFGFGRYTVQGTLDARSG